MPDNTLGLTEPTAATATLPRGAELAHAALNVIACNPDLWNQSTSMCGSKGCFMGHVVFIGLGLSTEEDFDRWARPLGGAGVMPTAQELLGWTYDEADLIFGLMTDDFEVLEQYVNAIVLSHE